MMDHIKKTQFNWEKIGGWIGIATCFFMFWQSMRDIHKDMIDFRKEIGGLSERISRLEVKVENLERKN